MMITMIITTASVPTTIPVLIIEQKKNNNGLLTNKTQNLPVIAEVDVVVRGADIGTDVGPLSPSLFTAMTVTE